MDDITHVNFTDRDHLWFDPNWKNGCNATPIPSNGNNNNTVGEDDPMAAMLENNAKNTNAANIFVNKLHGLVSEYAEVNHANLIHEHRTPNSNQQGPYATTNLIEPSNVSLQVRISRVHEWHKYIQLGYVVPKSEAASVDTLKKGMKKHRMLRFQFVLNDNLIKITAIDFKILFL